MTELFVLCLGAAEFVGVNDDRLAAAQSFEQILGLAARPFLETLDKRASISGPYTHYPIPLLEPSFGV